MSTSAVLQHHRDSARVAWLRLRQAPVASLFSILVIGIALALPAGLYLLVDNLQRAAGGLATQAEMTVFLKKEVDAADGQAMALALQKLRGVASARFVDRDAGLAELERGGLEEILTVLPQNPLPHALVIQPARADAALLDKLEQDLRARSEVDDIARASDWTRRLDALIRFGNTLAAVLGWLLGLAMAAITGNTIRLQIYALREEIEVSRLIGATDRFIRRPFLFFGLYQGLLGGLAAWLLTLLAVFALNLSVGEFAKSYGSDFVLTPLDVLSSLALLGGASLLGLAGAWLSVQYTLRRLI
jgi:cell division transport system permease protein